VIEDTGCILQAFRSLRVDVSTREQGVADHETSGRGEETFWPCVLALLEGILGSVTDPRRLHEENAIRRIVQMRFVQPGKFCDTGDRDAIG
jgi:hypothetical protein